MPPNSDTTAANLAAVTDATQVRQLTERLFRAVEDQDAIEYLDATYDPNVTIHESPSLPYGGDYRGLEGVLAHAEGYLSTWGPHQDHDDRAMNAQIYAAPDHAFVHWTLRLGGRDFPFISHYRFQRRRIIESWMFPFDAPALLDWWQHLRTTRP